MANTPFSYLASAELTDVGHRRQNNEDAILRLPENGIFCVADGMGGVQGGEVASKATVDALRKEFTESPEAPFAVTATSSARLVQRAIDGASRWIKERADGLGLTGTGSTVVLLAFDRAAPSKAVVLHAGDSRAYRYRRDKLVQLMTDHSAAAAAGLRDDKTLPAMFRGVITRAVGLDWHVELESTVVDVAAGDTFLLCSDGLDKMLSDRQIHKILSRHQEHDLQELAKALVAAALEAGGDDNVSVVLVRVAKELPPEATLEISPRTLALEQLPSAATTAATAAAKATPANGGNLVGTTPVTPASVPLAGNRRGPSSDIRPAFAGRPGGLWTSLILLALALGAGIGGMVRWRAAKDAEELHSVLPPLPVKREAVAPVPSTPETSAVPAEAVERSGTGD